jgi:hypothetical protein
LAPSHHNNDGEARALMYTYEARIIRVAYPSELMYTFSTLDHIATRLVGPLYNN